MIKLSERNIYFLVNNIYLPERFIFCVQISFLLSFRIFKIKGFLLYCLFKYFFPKICTFKY